MQQEDIKHIMLHKIRRNNLNQKRITLPWDDIVYDSTQNSTLDRKRLSKQDIYTLEQLNNERSEIQEQVDQLSTFWKNIKTVASINVDSDEDDDDDENEENEDENNDDNEEKKTKDISLEKEAESVNETPNANSVSNIKSSASPKSKAKSQSSSPKKGSKVEAQILDLYREFSTKRLSMQTYLELCPRCKIPLTSLLFYYGQKCVNCKYIQMGRENTTATLTYAEENDMKSNNTQYKPIDISVKHNKYKKQLLWHRQKANINPKILVYVLDQIIKKENIKNILELRWYHVYECIHSLKISELFNHVTQIYCRLTDRPAPQYDLYLDQIATRIYNLVDPHFFKTISTMRKRLPYCPFTWGKVWQDVGLVSLFEYIPLYNARDDFTLLESIWQKTCSKLGVKTSSEPLFDACVKWHLKQTSLLNNLISTRALNFSSSSNNNNTTPINDTSVGSSLQTQASSLATETLKKNDDCEKNVELLSIKSSFSSLSDSTSTMSYSPTSFDDSQEQHTLSSSNTTPQNFSNSCQSNTNTIKRNNILHWNSTLDQYISEVIIL